MRIIVGIVVVGFLVSLFVRAIGDYEVIGPDGVMLCGILLAAGVMAVFKPE